MPDTHFGPITHLGTLLNSSDNLLLATWGLASFPTPNQTNGNFVFYVSGQEGISVHSLLANGDFLELEQSVTDTAESLLSGLSGIEVVKQGGKSFLIGVSTNDAALNVFEIEKGTGLLTFVSAVSEGLTLATADSVTHLRVGSQSFVLTCNRFNENLGIWQLSDAGILTRVSLVSGAIQPLAGVTATASLHLTGSLTNRDGFVTASGEGLTLWQVDGTGAVTQLDNIAGNGFTTLDVGSYRDGKYLLAGDGAAGTVRVVEVGSDEQLTTVSTFDLKAAGFFGNVTSVRSFTVDGIRLAMVVIGVGEILVMGMGEGGALHVVDSWELVNNGLPPVRNAEEVELVFTDGQALLVIAGTQPQTEANLEGVSVFTIGYSNDVLVGSAANDDFPGFLNEDSISGLGGQDRLYGGKGFDTLLGGAGSDRLGGGLGDDLLSGGPGDDTLAGDEGADSLEGGFGLRDLATYENAIGKVTINLDTGFCGGNGALGDIIVNIEWLEGSRFGDTLTGDDLDNGLYGGDGGDRMNGGAGNDVLSGGTGENTINGGAGDDYLYGGPDINLLFGGDGNDRIRFGNGNDFMRGGAGADGFIWVPTGSEVGRILDFTQGEDLIDLSAITPNFVTPETLLGLLETVGGVHTFLLINADRGIIIRDITADQFTLDDFIL